MHRTIVFGSVVFAAVAITGAANSADLRTRPVYKAPPIIAPNYNWSGFYVGGNIGYGWNDDSGNVNCINAAGVLNGTGCGEILIPGVQVRSEGIIGGGQIGYNWQVKQWVYGVEADFQGADIHGSKSINGPFNITGGGTTGPGIFTLDQKIDWFGTVRGRFGWASDRILVFVTGGLIYGHTDVTKYSAYPPPPAAPAFAFPASGSFTKAGWTIGGGAEYAFANNWSAKVEGLYYDMGTVEVYDRALVPTPLIGWKTFTLEGGLVRAGLNYHFGR